MNRSGARHASVRSPISLADGLSIGVSTIRPCSGRWLAKSPSSQAAAPGPAISYLA